MESRDETRQVGEVAKELVNMLGKAMENDSHFYPSSVFCPAIPGARVSFPGGSRFGRLLPPI